MLATRQQETLSTGQREGWYDTQQMGLAENTRRIRRARGLSQAALAEAAGVKQQLISQIENGKNITTKKLPDIAKALDCRVYDLDPSYRPAETEGRDDLLGKFNQILSSSDEDQLQRLDDYLDFLLSRHPRPDDSTE